EVIVHGPRPEHSSDPEFPPALHDSMLGAACLRDDFGDRHSPDQLIFLAGPRCRCAGWRRPSLPWPSAVAAVVDDHELAAEPDDFPHHGGRGLPVGVHVLVLYAVAGLLRSDSP